MARYIDADKIDLNKYPIGRSLATDWIDIEDVKRAIALTPTADVVPKSENDAVVSAVDNSTKEFLKLHDNYQEAKRELEELIKSVDDMLDLVCAMTGLDLTCFGKYAELKKKYVKDAELQNILNLCERREDRNAAPIIIKSRSV